MAVYLRKVVGKARHEGLNVVGNELGVSFAGGAHQAAVYRLIKLMNSAVFRLEWIEWFLNGHGFSRPTGSHDR